MTQPGGLDAKGSFSVDITQAPRAIQELEAARRELRSIRDEALSLTDVRPGAADQVSIDAATALSRRANGSPASLMESLDQGIAELTRMIDALRAGFADYEHADDGARRSFAQRR
ncbi:PE domain-containing protein [Actinomycetospora sp. C-140]